MAHSNREDQSEDRKLHKIAVKQERAEKIKKKTMWELLSDDRAGVIQPKEGEEDDGKKKFKVRTRKVKTENRRSHRHGLGKPSNKVCVVNLDGSVVYTSRKHAEMLVAKGASYTNKTAWRVWRNAEMKRESHG